jgi:WD40 repeat protein
LRNVTISPDGKLLAGYNEGKVRVWNLASGRKTSLEFSKPNGVFCVKWSPAGVLATADANGRVELWDMEDREHWDSAEPEPMYQLDMPTYRAPVLDWSDDGELLAAGGADGSIVIFRLATQEKQIWKGHERGIHCVAWSPDSRSLVSSGRSGPMIVWNAETGKERFSLDKKVRDSPGVDWSPDSTRIASGGRDAKVGIWDGRNGQEMMILEGHEMFVASVAWNHDGTCLASSDADGVTKIWDARKGYAEERARLENAGGDR